MPLGRMAQEFVDGWRGMRQNGAMSLSIVVCDADEAARRALAGVIAEHGFDLVAEATLAVEAVQLATAHAAQVIALSNELQGLSGLEVVEELEAADVRVILISNDPRALEQARALGAFFAVDRGDLEMFDRALNALGDGVDGDRPDGDRRSGLDRRRGLDRRVRQDWSLVTRERRSGTDRRQAERRMARSAGAPAPSGATAHSA